MSPHSTFRACTATRSPERGDRWNQKLAAEDENLATEVLPVLLELIPLSVELALDGVTISLNPRLGAIEPRETFRLCHELNFSLPVLCGRARRSPSPSAPENNEIALG